MKKASGRGRFALALAAMLSALPALVGCVHPQLGPLSDQEIATHGTMEMSAPRDTVFEACITALRMEGYVIDVAERVTGLVVTRFKRPQAVGSEARRSRGYVVRVQQLAPEKVQVVVLPTAGEPLPLPPVEPTWDLEHERAGWSRLFEDVKMLVAREEAEPN